MSVSLNLASNLLPSTFVASVARELQEHYARLGREPEVHTRSRLAKIWWGENGSVHYEIALHERTMQLELGLHFEDSPGRNHELYKTFSPRLLEIQQELGDSVWLEEWDRGWTRIYETQPLFPLDETRLLAVMARMSEIIDCLQPILETFEANE